MERATVCVSAQCRRFQHIVSDNKNINELEDDDVSEVLNTTGKEPKEYKGEPHVLQFRHLLFSQKRT